jgi:chromosome segregation ATPase
MTPEQIQRLKDQLAEANRALGVLEACATEAEQQRDKYAGLLFDKDQTIRFHAERVERLETDIKNLTSHNRQLLDSIKNYETKARAAEARAEALYYELKVLAESPWFTNGLTHQQAAQNALARF